MYTWYVPGDAVSNYAEGIQFILMAKFPCWDLYAKILYCTFIISLRGIAVFIESNSYFAHQSTIEYKFVFNHIHTVCLVWGHSKFIYFPVNNAMWYLNHMLDDATNGKKRYLSWYWKSRVVHSVQGHTSLSILSLIRFFGHILFFLWMRPCQIRPTFVKYFRHRYKDQTKHELQGRVSAELFFYDYYASITIVGEMWPCQICQIKSLMHHLPLIARARAWKLCFSRFSFANLRSELWAYLSLYMEGCHKWC